MGSFFRIFKRKPKFENDGSVYSIMWKQFLKNKLNVVFLCVLIIAVFISLIGYLITPDSTPYANAQYLELTLQKPGTRVTMVKIAHNKIPQTQNLFSKMFFGSVSRYVKIPVTEYDVSGDSLHAVLFTGIEDDRGISVSYHIIDVLFHIDTTQQVIFDNNMYFWTDADKSKRQISQNEALTAIKKNIYSQKFILGTDRFGRDVLSQLIIGARVSLSVGLIAVIISLLIGVTLGALSGYYGGRVDKLIMWLINVVWAIPTLFLVIAITFALGKGFWQIFIAVGLTLWVDIARLVRGMVMSLRNREYVEAAHALGYSDRRIIFHHILPGTLGPIIVVSAANFASAILIESGLSFLGIGIQPPMPSWGTMLRENYGFLIMDYAYLAIIPGIAIMILVLTFMILGNGIRDAMDVKQLQSER